MPLLPLTGQPVIATDSPLLLGLTHNLALCPSPSRVSLETPFSRSVPLFPSEPLASSLSLPPARHPHLLVEQVGKGNYRNGDGNGQLCGAVCMLSASVSFAFIALWRWHLFPYPFGEAAAERVHNGPGDFSGTLQSCCQAPAITHLHKQTLSAVPSPPPSQRNHPVPLVHGPTLPSMGWEAMAHSR